MFVLTKPKTMTKIILKLLLTSVAVLLIAHVLPGVTVVDFGAALLVALVLGILRIFVKPIMVLLTLPITILTFGLFLFIIDALIVYLIPHIVDKFIINSFWTALLFSLILSVLQSILYGFLEEK